MASEATERRPLLYNAEASPKSAPPPAKHRIVYTAIIGFLVNAAYVTAIAFSNGAMDQLVEGAACQRLYPDVTDRYHDRRCKNDDVQSQLSLVNGWQTTFGIVPGLLVAVPYGFFADKYGPRALLPLTFLGTTTTQFVQQLMCKLNRIPRRRRG
jgi:MFS family permease